ncbi:MBOAT family O-acyltransferase [Carboxylicivirga sp. N1Y90]|uniref:MBOAT family O-acyltransferase n=1 Tax=Carboxylicivirga fragile TaxID=3417571 RepID=UPI003D353E04|nr:MBOAT family protein [Marinilabiliaceae bacterium N1Y90]
MIDSTGDEDRKLLLMRINVALILVPLFFFKYFTIINNELLELLELNNLRWPLPEIKFILPIGISYYTFMSIGYTIDVYNEDIKADKHFGRVALFTAFFPLILSGPIERAGNMLPQFKNLKQINFSNISGGLKMMLWGYFMKLVVADRIGIYVDAIYGDILGHNGTSLLIATVLYPFQVYADLGGYSLIAIGVAKILGIDVMQNFNRPFFATSMAEFWRRWHMSLITWLTDYVYTPLSFAFRKIGMLGIIIALMVTFLLSGIWHHADMTSIMWGLTQGTFLSIEALLHKRRFRLEEKYQLTKSSLYLFSCMLVTFVLFSASQIFGRAVTIEDSWAIFDKLFTNIGVPYLDLTTLLYSFIGIFLLLIKDFKNEFMPVAFNSYWNRKLYLRYAAYLTVLFGIILFGVFEGGNFIYFQF